VRQGGDREAGGRDQLRGRDGREAGRGEGACGVWQWSFVVAVGKRVAVVGWQWDIRKRKITAVILSGDKFEIGWQWLGGSGIFGSAL
jgi:hypothetical protein